MKLFRRGKKFWAALGLAMISMFVAAMSTAAWAEQIVDTPTNSDQVRAQLAPSPTVQPDGNNPSSDEWVAEVSALTNRFAGKYVDAGWLHVVTTYDRGVLEAGALEDGSTIPVDFTLDRWYLLNSSGEVYQSVGVMRDMSGETKQTVVFSGGVSLNLATGERRPQTPYPLNLDFGFADSLSRGPDWYGSLDRRESALAGESVIQFTTREQFSEAIEFTGFSMTFTAVERRAYFNADDGKLMLLRTVGFGDDGEEIFISEVQHVLIEYSEPPQELLLILEGVE